MTSAETGWQPGTVGRPRARAGWAPAIQSDRVNGGGPGPYQAARGTARDDRASQAPAQVHPGTGAGESQLPDLALYERLTGDGIAAADARGSAVDHVTARRLAICLAARPQSLDFVRSLVRFVRTGAVSQALKAQLRLHSRSARFADQPQAARLMEYCTVRGADLGPVGENFGADCDPIDRADIMLAGLRHRARHRRTVPGPTWPETSGPPGHRPGPPRPTDRHGHLRPRHSVAGCRQA